MDKNKKKIVRFWLWTASPFVLSALLLCFGIRWYLATLPVTIPVAFLLLLSVISLWLSMDYRIKHRKKCCGNCVHCPDDVYWKFRSRCLRDGHEFERPARHSCKQFYGSVTKDYIGPKNPAENS